MCMYNYVYIYIENNTDSLTPVLVIFDSLGDATVNAILYQFYSNFIAIAWPLHASSLL